MVKSSSTRSAIKLPKSKFPRCLHCNKAVETLTVAPNSNNPGKIIIEYQCHGERVSQEMPSSVLADGQGLASYTAFNAFTSGLMLHESLKKSKVKKDRKA